MSNSSWKQYGGVQKTDRLQHISIGTLVVDQILQKKKNTLDLEINGSLKVVGDITTSGGGNVYSKNDLYVNNSGYFNNNLYFGTNTQDNNTYGHIYGDSITGTFGINAEKSTDTTKAIFDIYSNSSTVFAARTSGTTINNILAENKNTNNNNDSVNAYATTGRSALNLVVGGSTVGSLSATGSTLLAQAPIISINSSTSNLSITAANGSNFTITPTNGSNFTTTIGDTVIQNSTGNILLQVPAGNTIISSLGRTVIDSSAGIQFRSKLGISNRGIYSSISGELVTIYDISKNSYLYDYYNNTLSNTGDALTLVTSDSSSNTFLNILTPAKNGFSVGGGTFINDYNRSMGTFGLTTASGIYIASQTIVSGTSKINYLTCTGINTYVPKSETYVLDINGPTRIGNGEINTRQRINYEILQMKYSKRVKGTAIAVGSSNNLSSPFTQTASYSIDNGKTWSTSNIGAKKGAGDAINSNDQSFNVFVYDKNTGFVSSSKNNGVASNVLFYTTDGGANWTQLGDSQTTAPNIKTFSSIYVYDDTPGNHTLLVPGRNVSLSTNLLFYKKNFGFTDTLITYSSVGISLTTINDSDGSGIFLYVVGSGIQKFSVDGTGPTSLYTYKLNDSIASYNSVFAYDNNYAIAVGNTISYTKDSTTWQQSTVNNMPTNYNLRSVYIYDLLNAIAVGDSGKILYTTDGAVTWNPIPDNILNSSGISSRITSSNNNLRGIFMPDLDSFVIANVNTSYNLAGSVLGNSKILYGFFPSLFNNTNNKVLDVSGNVEVSGDICIDGSGQLKSTNAAFNIVNDTVTTISLGGATTQINFGGSQSNIQILGKAYVNGDLSLNSRLFVNGDASLNSRLYVNCDASLNSRLFVKGDASLNSRLYVNGDASLNSRLFVKGDVSLNSRLYVNGDASLNSQLFVKGDASFNGIISSGSIIYSPIYDTKLSTLYVGSKQSNNSIYIGSREGASNGNVFVGSASDTVYLQGSVVFQSAGTFAVNTNTIQINATNTAINSSNSAGIQIRDYLNDNAGYIKVSNDINAYNFKAPKDSNILRIDVKNLTFSGSNSPMVVLKNTSTTYTDSNYSFVVNTNVDANYNGTGKFYVAIPSILNGDASLNGKLAVGSTATFNSGITSAADSTFNSDMYVSKTGYFAKSVAINKTTVSSEKDVVLDVSGNISQIGSVVFQF